MSRSKGRKPGGQPGNLNAARDARAALRRLEQGRQLPAHLERVCALADLEAGELISDKGGWQNMSGAERLMVSTWKAAKQAELIIWHYLLQSGTAIRGDGKGAWDLQPGMQRLSVFLAEQRRCLVTLGMERRAKPVPDLRTYLQEEYGGGRD